MAERRALLQAQGALDASGLAGLLPQALALDVADGMIENVIGGYALPMAVALNFVINGVARLVPMCVEEASIVAAASFAAKMAAPTGGFTVEVAPPVMVGQIQLRDVANPAAAVAAILAHKDALLAEARASMPRLIDRGGGPRDVSVRILATPDSPDGGMVVVHFHVDCRDAMGANLINTLCEKMAPTVAALGQGRVGLRILSNYSDERTVTVTAHVRASELVATADAAHARVVRDGIVGASRFAELDPYRATTHNKGIMNGIDAVLLATGQDWRAVEAGAHAYAARSGHYAPLAVWRADGDDLRGSLTVPMAVGAVGGALLVHPGAKAALQLANVTTAADLAAMAAAAGLATNLAALRALATEGIQRGHMALHARSIARAAGASADTVEAVATALVATGDISLARAQSLVLERKKDGAV